MSSSKKKKKNGDLREILEDRRQRRSYKDKDLRNKRRRRDSSSSSSLSLSPEPPQRVDRPLDDFRRRKLSPRRRDRSRRSEKPRRKDRRESRKSWSDKVNDFVASLNVSPPSSSSLLVTPPPEQPPPIHPENNVITVPSGDEEEREKKREKTMNGESKSEGEKKETPDDDDVHPPGEDAPGEEVGGVSEDYETTPLVRYIGKRLRNLKDFELKGIFQYNVLSLLSRSEWIGAKTVALLKEAGYDESELYRLATSASGALETELKSAVFTEKVKLGGKPRAVQQVLRVIQYIVEYFTSKGEGQGEESDESEDEVPNGAVKSGIGHFLQRLSENVDEVEEKCKEKETKEIDSIPPPADINPWSRMWDAIQSQNLSSFQHMKNFIAKDLLRLHGRNFDAFGLAQEMVSCWVVAGFGLQSLRHLVLQTPNNNILPQSDFSGKRCLYDDLLKRLTCHTSEISPLINEDHLKYLVRKSLVYVMRGCDKLQGGSFTSLKAPGNERMNIVFNYLPPGLREAESSAPRLGTDEYVEEVREPEVRSKTKGIIHQDEEDKLSTDPLNAVLNPPREPHNPNQLPNRKYNVVTLHLEWVILKGQPQIYEISAFSSADMNVLNIYAVTKSLQKSPDALENLGFVANPDRHEYYYVQVGIGCVKAMSLESAIEKLASFLEEKRNFSDSENRNNGLVLITHSVEEMGNFLKVLESTNYNNLLLDVVKGVGTLETFMERNKSKKLYYGGPKLSLSGGDEAFYNTEVKKSIHTFNLVSKSKSEAVYSSLEHMLDNSVPNFSNFISPHCVPSFSPVAEDIRRRNSKVREFYTLEVFLSAQLKIQKINLFLEGVFAPNLVRDLRDKASIVANRIICLLVRAGYDKNNLSECFKKDKEFALNSNVFLESMNMSQRLKVMDQTMRCIHIIKDYYLSSQSS